MDQVLAKGEAWALILMISVMTLVVFLQVVFRYLLSQPLHWSEEMARFLFVWLSILGATLAVQKRGHFGLDIFHRMMSAQGKRWMAILVDLLTFCVVLIILIQGVILVQKTIWQESPAMMISMAWAYASLPVGAVLMALHLLVILMQDSIKKEIKEE